MRITTLSLFISLSTMPIAAVDQHLPTDQSVVHRDRGVPASSTLNQTPNQATVGYSDSGCSACSSGLQVIAENVLVSTGGVGFDLDQIVIWGGYLNGSPPPVDDFDLLIHSDAGGLPGTVICSQTDVVPTARVATGNTVIGVAEYMYTIDLATACHLEDDTYWVEIFGNTPGDAADWFWEGGNDDPVNGLPGIAFSRTQAPGTSWIMDTFTTAIQMNGTLLPVELQSFSVE